MRSGVQIEGANAVVVGRSNIVGMPAARLLQDKNATVTVCHSRTKDLPEVVARADIIIAAIGRAEMIKKEWVKPGAVIIDVGINAVGLQWLCTVFDSVLVSAGGRSQCQEGL